MGGRVNGQRHLDAGDCPLPGCILHDDHGGACRMADGTREHQDERDVPTPLDLVAISAKWLEPCGYCDGGLPMSCTHPDEDYRVPMLELVLEVDRLRRAVTR